MMKKQSMILLTVMLAFVIFVIVGCSKNQEVEASPDSHSEPPLVETSEPPLVETSEQPNGSPEFVPENSPEPSENYPKPTTGMIPEFIVIMPNQTYLGTWYTDDFKLDVLNILEISEDKIDFSMGIYRITSITATAENDGGVYKFTTEGPPLSGTLEFRESSISVIIDDSNFEYIKAGNIYSFIVKSED